MSLSETLPAPQAAVAFSDNYRRYVLGILLVVFTFNFIDRQILAILLQPIKQDLGLSDTQLGLLTGIAFSLFYVSFGIPLARLADRSSRVNIISGALVAWSTMTALCGLAQNLWQLLFARIGVGIGEAGCIPPSQSLISDYFAPEKRAMALSIFALGVPIGVMFGFLVGGWMEEYFGWRTAFLVVGLPGILLAIIVRLTLREPPRGLSETTIRDHGEQPSMREVARYLWGLRSFRHVAFAAALHAFVGYGVVSWLPSFLARSYQMGGAEIGTWLALLAGIVGGLGTVAGGWLGDRYAKKDRRWYVWISGITILLAVPFTIYAFLGGDKYWTLAMYILPTFFGAFYHGPTGAVIQGLAQVRMRAISAALYVLMVNLIGLGLGPLAVGVISDLLAPAYGVESLRYALLCVFLVNIWSALHYLFAAKTLRADLDSNPDRIAA
ncbi:MAG: spinster family MFS transporter [Pseudomonadota bacterium]